ncbi:hypothetical protein QAD02_021143 [Eretmocerus hayati]|uniref:Uncharacterized protein n=1 Tax=Eretmocerus hayati TaxID=131215 RepID=A0ACC2PU81_9HYME|nr:hypothetical protein QAD02_021143 [Eretmocerus hayati]
MGKRSRNTWTLKSEIKKKQSKEGNGSGKYRFKRLEDYSDQETLEDELNNNRKNVPDKNETKEEENEKSEEKMDIESRERKIRGKLKLVVRKGIAWNGRYVEAWIKEVTGEDFDRWKIEGLCKKGQSKAYGAWVLKTDSRRIEEKLLGVMQRNGEKEFIVERFMNAAERWERKEKERGIQIMRERGYKVRTTKKGIRVSKDGNSCEMEWNKRIKRYMKARK